MSGINVKQNSRLSDLINYKLKVFTQDGRVYIGELLAFDKYMNLILSDCIEERIPRGQLLKLNSKNKDVINSIKPERRVLGLTILRGENVLSTVVEDKPNTTKRQRLQIEKQQEKKIKKQKRQNKNQKKSRSNTTTDNLKSNQKDAKLSNGPQPRKFQPPPGFKRI